MTRSRIPWWTLFALALVVALLVGSGLLGSSPPTNAERAHALESIVRCPSCEDLSAANSSAPTAAAVRADIRLQVAAGHSDRQIEQSLEAKYGNAIVLDPPASGWSLLVWLVPLVGIVVAAFLVGRTLYRRRALANDGEAGSGTGGDLPPASEAERERRRRFLEQSLADADAEFQAGDLAADDYRQLRDRDEAALLALDAPVSAVVATRARTATAGMPGPEAGVAPETDPPTSVRTSLGRYRRWFLVGTIVCFLGAVVGGVTLFASNRLPGQTETGSLNLSTTQQITRTLAQAAVLENQGQLAEAASLYRSVLVKEPVNEVALVQLGWLEYQIGVRGGSATLVADALVKLNQATQLSPSDYAAHLYLGTYYAQQGALPEAVAQFRAFLATQPPPALVAQARSEIVATLQKAGQSVPASLGG
jgi:cytochrome c-type biogenesis protein CcmH